MHSWPSLRQTKSNQITDDTNDRLDDQCWPQYLMFVAHNCLNKNFVYTDIIVLHQHFNVVEKLLLFPLRRSTVCEDKPVFVLEDH